jgi:hypothetical protein
MHTLFQTSSPIITHNLLKYTDPCNSELMSDGNCDYENDWSPCDYDGGDCIVQCEGQGDGECHPEWNTEQCDWDGGDCCGPEMVDYFAPCDGCGCLDPGKCF